VNPIAQLGTRKLGFVLLAIALILLIAAVNIAYSGINRWLALYNLKSYTLSQLQGEHEEAREAITKAASRLPKRAATVLPSVDLTTDNGLERLDRLRRIAPLGERQIIATAIAFGQASRKNSPTGDYPENSDAVLIRWLVALNTSTTPKSMALSKEDPPHSKPYTYVLQRHFQAGIASGNVDMLRDSAGRLVLLYPRHPEIDKVRFVAALCDPAFPSDALRNMGSSLNPPESRTALVRRLGKLFPDRSAYILPLIPAEQRTEDENHAVLLTSPDTLETTVGLALASPTEPILRSMSTRCLNSNRPDLARRLAAVAHPPLTDELLLNIAIYEGDLSALAKLSGEKTNLQPQISKPVAHPGMIAFHLSTPSGVIPRAGALEVIVGGVVMTSNNITRFGSLVLIEVSDRGPVAIEVKLDGTALFVGQVQL
jgi:hypothetical protein